VLLLGILYSSLGELSLASLYAVKRIRLQIQPMNKNLVS